MDNDPKLATKVVTKEFKDNKVNVQNPTENLWVYLREPTNLTDPNPKGLTQVNVAKYRGNGCKLLILQILTNKSLTYHCGIHGNNLANSDYLGRFNQRRHVPVQVHVCVFTQILTNDSLFICTVRICLPRLYLRDEI